MSAAPGFSLHEQVLDVALTALLAAHTSAAERVERSRRDAMSVSDFEFGPCITLARADGSFNPFGSDADEAGIGFTVSCWAKGEAWETEADALHIEAHTALRASPELAALVRGLTCTGTEIVDQTGDENIGRINASYEARAVTRRADLGRMASGT